MISNLVELKFKEFRLGVAVYKGDKVIALLDLDQTETIESCYVLKLMKTLCKGKSRSYKELVKAEDKRIFSLYYGYKEADLNNEYFQAYVKARIGGLI